ncbi:MAG: polysaccharide deacetylase family protein [Candidatus Heimdallarchaeota archaeon]|nr:polysaccharide deacetylase family protein [Candidatus Heimdallarchaeota archaeon]
MSYVFICIDFDRDYAIPMDKHKHAVSNIIKNESEEITKDPELSVSLKGTIESFNPLITYLNDNKVPTTFYHEARSLKLFNKLQQNSFSKLNQPFFEHGLHGYDHEDLTGEETGIKFSEDEEFELLQSAKKEIENLLSTEVHGFRAPYMKLSSNTIDILSKLEFTHDSSIYKQSEAGIFPYKINDDIIEFPVIKTPKESVMKGMYTYLWPLFEGKRSEEEVVKNYVQILKNSKDKNSYISINLHSWHFAYFISQNRYLTKTEIQKNVVAFTNLIDKLEEHGAMISTPTRWLEENNLF